MKRILFTLCVFFAFITSAYAGEMYICTDRNGNAIVTDSPQDGMKNCVLKGTGNDDYSFSDRGGWIEEKINNVQKKMLSRADRGEPASRGQKVVLEQLIILQGQGYNQNREKTKIDKEIIELIDNMLRRVERDEPASSGQATALESMVELRGQGMNRGSSQQGSSAAKIRRQQEDMEAAQARQNAEMQRQNAEIQKLEQQQRMQRNDDWLDRQMHP
jgi:hypothetical protein